MVDLRGLTREDVDRHREVSAALGSRSVTPGGVALCDDIVRLHDAMGGVVAALRAGDPAGALAIALAETDPSWGRPLDGEMPPEDNGCSPGG